MAAPNFVFILIDDLGWKDLGCYGSAFYQTPNLDRLAKGGMRFTDAYASCPVCSPTRASVMTGKYPARVGVTQFIGGSARGKLCDVPYVHHLPSEEHTIAAALRDAGYRTYFVGKWHLGGEDYWPDKHGFDENVAGCHWGMPNNGYFSPWGNPNLEDGPEGEYLTDRLTEEAIGLLEENGDAPFLLYMAYYTVHVPIQGKKEYVEMFRRRAREMGLDNVKTFEEGEHFPCEHKKEKRVQRRLVQSDPEYAAMVKSMDENIGRLLKAIDELGKTRDTVVFFTSDNGGLATAEGAPTCNLPLAEGKGWMYEGGTREPLIVRWPGQVEAGSLCDVPVTSTDFYPTMLEVAGVEPMPQQHRDGVSILPLLRGSERIGREAIYWHYPHYSNQGGTPGSSVRCADHKLIEFFEDGRLELYDLREDVGEDRDLSEEQPERTERLRRLLGQWQTSIEGLIPGPNPEYDPAEWPE